MPAQGQLDGVAALLEGLPGLPDWDGWMLLLVVALARAGGFLLALPHMSATVVPKTAKVAVVFAVSLSLVLAAPGRLPWSLWHHPWAIASAVGREFLLGLAMGALIHLALATVRLAGEVAGVEMGLSFSAVADPMTRGQSTAVSALFAQLGMQLFLALGLDHVAIRALALSAEGQPLGGGTPRIASFLDIPLLGAQMFTGAIQLALPLMAALFSLKIAMAMLARVAPRLQIFTLAFALSILTGLLVLDAALGGIAATASAQLQRWSELLVHLAGA